MTIDVIDEVLREWEALLKSLNFPAVEAEVEVEERELAEVPC